MSSTEYQQGRHRLHGRHRAKGQGPSIWIPAFRGGSGRHRWRRRISAPVAAGLYFIIGLTALGAGWGLFSLNVQNKASALPPETQRTLDGVVARFGERTLPPTTQPPPSPSPTTPPTSKAPPPPPPPPAPKPPPPPPKPAQQAWVSPVANYSFTSGFGWRWGAMHNGVDLAAPTGTPVRSVSSGTVELATWYGGYGSTVIVNHGGGVKTLYAHNSALKVRPGQQVSPGQTIALMGSTGNSTGSHCHFEVRVNGSPINPIPFMANKGVKL